MHIFSPSQVWPHQQTPSSLMMKVPVPQHLGSSVIGAPFFTRQIEQLDGLKGSSVFPRHLNQRDRAGFVNMNHCSAVK